MSTDSRMTKIQRYLTSIADDLRYLMNSSDPMTISSMSVKIGLMREQNWCKPKDPEIDIFGDDSSKYLNVWNIEWLENLPSVEYKYFNPLFDGLYEQIINLNFQLSREVEVIMYEPCILHTFDKNGVQGIVPAEITENNVLVTVTLQSIDDIQLGGQGVRFNITKVISSDSSELQQKDYLFTYVIAKDQQYTEIIYEKLSNKNQYFINFNSVESGTYYLRVHGTNKSTLRKTDYFTDQINFTYQKPNYTHDCCPLSLTSNPALDSNAEYILDTNVTVNIIDAEGNLQQKTGNDAAWVFFYKWNQCPPWQGSPDFNTDQYVSWSRTDQLKMIASNYVKLKFGSCRSPVACYFEGSNDNESWTSILTLPCDNGEWEYTYQLTQIAVYKYFRIRVSSLTRLNRIEVD